MSAYYRASPGHERGRDGGGRHVGDKDVGQRVNGRARAERPVAHEERRELVARAELVSALTVRATADKNLQVWRRWGQRHLLVSCTRTAALAGSKAFGRRPAAVARGVPHIEIDLAPAPMRSLMYQSLAMHPCARSGPCARSALESAHDSAHHAHAAHDSAHHAAHDSAHHDHSAHLAHAAAWSRASCEQCSSQKGGSACLISESRSAETKSCPPVFDFGVAVFDFGVAVFDFGVAVFDFRVAVFYLGRVASEQSLVPGPCFWRHSTL
eukprot:1318906-Rhodomonas_salina.4